jgi:hypothetical protein
MGERSSAKLGGILPDYRQMSIVQGTDEKCLYIKPSFGARREYIRRDLRFSQSASLALRLCHFRKKKIIFVFSRKLFAKMYENDENSRNLTSADFSISFFQKKVK